MLFIAGQIGWDETHRIVSDNFTEQFDRALANVIEVIQEAGGRPEQIARMVIYVTNKGEYLEQQTSIGGRYQARMGKHFPAMALVEVKALLNDEAKVEIEAVAVLNP